MLAVVIGLIVSAGVYFAYLWPSVEPPTDDELDPSALDLDPGPDPRPEATP